MNWEKGARSACLGQDLGLITSYVHEGGKEVGLCLHLIKGLLLEPVLEACVEHAVVLVKICLVDEAVPEDTLALVHPEANNIETRLEKVLCHAQQALHVSTDENWLCKNCRLSEKKHMPR
jgi:hypothetical protein